MRSCLAEIVGRRIIGWKNRRFPIGWILRWDVARSGLRLTGAIYARSRAGEIEIIDVSHFNPTHRTMTPLILAAPFLAAAGWAFLVYILGGGGGLAIAVFIILKLMGK